MKTVNVTQWKSLTCHLFGWVTKARTLVDARATKIEIHLTNNGNFVQCERLQFWNKWISLSQRTNATGWTSKRIILSLKRIAVFSSDFLEQALEIVAIHADKVERFLTGERPNVRLADCCLISMSCGVIFILIKSLWRLPFSQITFCVRRANFLIFSRDRK